MKKTWMMLLCLLVCLNFAACGDIDAPQKETVDQQTSAEKTDETFGLNESAKFKELKFTAIKLEESDGTDFFVPEANNVFVGVKFEIENISNEEQSVSTLLLFEGYVDDVKCEYSISAACAFDEGTLDGSIAAGKKLVGWYALEAPKDWQKIELQVQSNWLSNNAAKFVFENKN